MSGAISLLVAGWVPSAEGGLLNLTLPIPMAEVAIRVSPAECRAAFLSRSRSTIFWRSAVSGV